MRKSSSSARLSEVGDDVLCGQPTPQLRQLDDLREPLQDLEIGCRATADAGTLNLDHDILAGVKSRVVDLGDRRRSERFFFEGGEQVSWIAAQLLLKSWCTSRCRREGRRRAGQELRGQRLAERAPGWTR